MSGLLEDMIGQRTDLLRLLSLKTLPVAAALEKKAAVGGAEPGKAVAAPSKVSEGLFKHGVEITLEGGAIRNCRRILSAWSRRRRSCCGAAFRCRRQTIPGWY